MAITTGTWLRIENLLLQGQMFSITLSCKSVSSYKFKSKLTGGHINMLVNWFEPEALNQLGNDSITWQMISPQRKIKTKGTGAPHNHRPKLDILVRGGSPSNRKSWSLHCINRDENGEMIHVFQNDIQFTAVPLLMCSENDLTLLLIQMSLERNIKHNNTTNNTEWAHTSSAYEGK